MVRDDQALTGLNDLMVNRLFEKVRNFFKIVQISRPKFPNSWQCPPILTKYWREVTGHKDMIRLSYVDFNRTSHFRITRQQSDGRKVVENVTLWEWIYHAFELLNMPTIRTHWNHGLIGMITLSFQSGIHGPVGPGPTCFSIGLFVIIESWIHKQTSYWAKIDRSDGRITSSGSIRNHTIFWFLARCNFCLKDGSRNS